MTTATKTKPAPVQSEPIKTISVFGFDQGNRYPKFGFNDTLQKLLSYRAAVPVFQEIASEDLPENSHLVEIGALRTVVGGSAPGYGARPTYQNADGAKWHHAKTFLFAALAQCGLYGDIHIQQLRTVCPDTQDVDQVSSMQSLQGKHHATVNGKPINLVITEVAIYDEGQPAWVIATNQGLWAFPAALNGILDLGGGTAIARLFTPEGRPIRQTELVLPGTYQLAEKIQSCMGGPRSIPAILDAIENSTYRVPSGREFRKSFDYCLSEWLADLRGEMRSRWSAWEGQYGQIAIAGGSASLAISLVDSNPRYLMLDDPQFVSLRGLLFDV